MKHIASCSFGKDSIATILLAIENNEPLDGAVFSEVMFDLARNISGENPELWKELQSLSRVPNLCSYGFKYGMTLQEVEARMDAIDAQLTLF